MEMQLTDFENAAFVAFIVLLSRAVLAFHVDLTVLISQTLQNMERAHARDAVTTQKFFIPSYTCRFPPPAEPGPLVFCATVSSRFLSGCSCAASLCRYNHPTPTLPVLPRPGSTPGR